MTIRTDKEALDWCEKCHGPVIPMTLGERWLAWVCYWLALRWPHRFFVSRAHMAILPWAGNIAFRCVCRTQATGGSNGRG